MARIPVPDGPGLERERLLMQHPEVAMGMHAFARDEEGATMIEYALIAALISVAAITVLSPLGQKILAVFQDVLDAMP